MRLTLEASYLPNKIDGCRGCDCRFSKAQERTLEVGSLAEFISVELVSPRNINFKIVTFKTHLSL